MNEQELIDRIASEVIKRIEGAMAGKVATSPSPAPTMVPADVAKYIDHTMLMPDAADAAFDQLCNEAIQYGFKSVCVNSCRVKYVAQKLHGSDIAVCAVVGFPLGQMDSRGKAFEAGLCIEYGAHELDMVLNVGALKSGDLKLVEEDIRAVRRVTRPDTVLKVIIETALLTDHEKVVACQISKDAGADFVKTCTGFAGGGATPEDLALMRKTVGADMGVKASGGVRNFPRAVACLAAGANRLGAVSSVAIVTGEEGEGGY